MVWLRVYTCLSRPPLRVYFYFSIIIAFRGRAVFATLLKHFIGSFISREEP